MKYKKIILKICIVIFWISLYYLMIGKVIAIACDPIDISIPTILHYDVELKKPLWYDIITQEKVYGRQILFRSETLTNDVVMYSKSFIITIFSCVIFGIPTITHYIKKLIKKNKK